MRPARSRFPVAVATLSVLGVLVACNGRLTGSGSSCVDVEPSMFDTSCTSDTDCVDVSLGNLCDGECQCGGAAINVADQGKYDQLVAGVQPGACFCPAMGSPACVAGQCTMGGVSTRGGDAGSDVDGGGSCVTVQPSSFSTSCSGDDDCSLVTTGTLCTGSCNCGNTPIGNSGLPQWAADVASVTFSACACGSPGSLACVNGTCTLCPPGELCGGGTSLDAGACVDLEPSMFDTSCNTSSDCIDVSLGMLCDRDCLCGGASINADDQPEYDQLVASVPSGLACNCGVSGTPLCLAGQCIVCGGTAPPNAACEDAGQ